MRFCSLGSGSSGNATLVEVTCSGLNTRLLIDCGLPFKTLEARLALLQLSLTDIDAVFVTHEHSDHIGCARQIAVQTQRPIWMSRGTYQAIGAPDLQGQWHAAQDNLPIRIGDLHLVPFTVAHDAKEPLQLTVSSGGKRFGLLTDLGHVTPYVISHLFQLNALVLECNHDPDLLASSKYPPFLKQRISGAYGHLSNQQAADALRAIAHPGLQYIVAAHLSEENNHPELAHAALSGALSSASQHIVVANADSGFDWLSL